MKKIIAIMLVLIMLFALTACAGNSQEGGVSDSAAPESSSSSSDTPGSTAPTTAPSAAAPSAAAPSAVPSNDPYAEVQAPDASGTVGYFTDDVDNFARDPYDFVYCFSVPNNLTMYMTECFEVLCEKYNYNLTTATANGDTNLYVNNIIPAVLLNEPDGLIIDMPFEFQTRLIEILDESGVSYISLFNSVTDESGYELVPVVMMNQYVNGQKQLELQNDSYKDYWGDIDTSELALLAMEFSLNADLATRARGARERFAELYPDNKIFVGDVVTAGATTPTNSQAAFDVASGIISGNPDIKYWFITCSTEDMSIGIARATEALGKTDSTLITGSGMSILPDEWDAGYEGNWIGNFAVSNYQYAVPMVCGLIALVDGRAAPGTLWEELKRPGDIAAQFVVGTQCITRDMYKDFFRQIEEGFGLYLEH